MGANQAYDVGAELKVAQGTVPVADTGSGAVNGSGIDRQGLNSCVLHLTTGAATGAPTAQTADAKLQESSDNGSSDPFVDISGAAVTQVAADNGHSYKDVNLRMAKRYIRSVHTVALTGGSTPTWPVATEVVLGGPDYAPVA